MSNIVSRLKIIINRGSFTRHVAVLAGGTVIGQLFIIASTPLVTRLYTPEALGQFGLLFTYTDICVVLSALSYEAAIVSAKDDDEAAHLTVLSICLALTTSALAAIGASLFRIFHILGFEKFPVEIYFWVFLILVPASIFSSLKYWLIRFQEFKVIGTVTIFQNIGRSIAQVLLGLLPLGWIGLLLGEFIGRSLGLSKMLQRSLTKIWQFTKSINAKKILRVASIYSNFPRYLLPSSMINVIASNLSIPIIVYLHGAEAGGLFFLAQRILTLPVSLIGNSVADVFHSQASEYMRYQPRQIRGFFLKTSLSLFAIGLLPMSILAAWGQDLFSWFAGSQWRESGKLLVFMAPAALAGLTVSPLSRLVNVVNGQKWKLFYDGIILANQFIVLCIGIHSKSTLSNTVLMLSFFSIISYLLYFIILFRLANNASNLV